MVSNHSTPLLHTTSIRISLRITLVLHFTSLALEFLRIPGHLITPSFSSLHHVVISLHFCASFTWRQLTGSLYVVFHSWRRHHRLTFRSSTSQHFCLALHFEKTLSFQFVPCHFTLFFTSLGDNFVVSLCTSSLHSCFSLHITFVFRFTWRHLCRFTLYLVTSLLFFTIQYNITLWQVSIH